jgi:hypothetical protein
LSGLVNRLFSYSIGEQGWFNFPCGRGLRGDLAEGPAVIVGTLETEPLPLQEKILELLHATW